MSSIIIRRGYQEQETAGSTRCIEQQIQVRVRRRARKGMHREDSFVTINSTKAIKQIKIRHIHLSWGINNSEGNSEGMNMRHNMHRDEGVSSQYTIYANNSLEGIVHWRGMVDTRGVCCKHHSDPRARLNFTQCTRMRGNPLRTPSLQTTHFRGNCAVKKSGGHSRRVL